MSELIVINAPPSIKRKTSRKKPTFKISIKTEPMIHDLGAIKRNAAPAEAIKEELQRRIRAVSKPVSNKTRARRARYANEYFAGAPTAQKRYGATRTKSGALRRGGIGDTPPILGAAYWFNDSGRLAKGLHVRANPKEGEFFVNVPGNRFDITTFGDRTQFEIMLSEFDRLIDPAGAILAPKVAEAISASVIDAVQAQLARNKSARRALRAANLRLIGTTLKTLRVLL